MSYVYILYMHFIFYKHFETIFFPEHFENKLELLYPFSPKNSPVYFQSKDMSFVATFVIDLTLSAHDSLIHSFHNCIFFCPGTVLYPALHCHVSTVSFNLEQFISLSFSWP